MPNLTHRERTAYAAADDAASWLHMVRTATTAEIASMRLSQARESLDTAERLFAEQAAINLENLRICVGVRLQCS